MVVGDGVVKSAERVATLLELLAGNRAPMRLVEVAAGLDIPKSSAHGLLQTLAAHDLVVRDDMGRYRIGLKLFSLSANALGFLDVREIARPTMEALAARQHATCNLAVLDGHDVLYVEKVEDRSNPVRLVTHVGTRLPAHVTSLGKVLVAELPESSRNLWISEHDFTKFTPQTRTTSATFARDLAAYRRHGFAVDAREYHDAIHGFAARVTDRAGTVVAALSLTSLGTRLSRDARMEIGTEVCAAAAEISCNLTTGGVLGIGDET